MDPVIIVPETAGLDDREVIAAGIRGFNQGRAGASNAEALAVLLKDEAGVTLGGLWGRTSYGWLFVELLFVPDHLRGRGLGVALMQDAERVARTRGCHAAWLDTYDFQAPAFYERLGYSIFGKLEDHPKGYTRYFVTKKL